MATKYGKEKCLGCGYALPDPRPAQCPRENCGVVPPASAEKLAKEEKWTGIRRKARR